MREMTLEDFLLECIARECTPRGLPEGWTGLKHAATFLKVIRGGRNVKVYNLNQSGTAEVRMTRGNKHLFSIIVTEQGSVIVFEEHALTLLNAASPKEDCS